MNPPPADPRRAAALRDYLRRLAPALTPQWEPTGGRDDFGSALLEIAARLAEETTVRLDRTAERDALAFFDFLGLPPDPPHAATGVLVLALAANHPSPVFAAPRTQITTAGGPPFETTEGLRVVPGRIADVIAVDPAADRIEPAPADVVSPSPPAIPAPDYKVATFADRGSLVLQLSPAVGPTPGDLLRIGQPAYRVAAADKNGLVTLLDPLEAAAPADTVVTRIRSLESFRLRDLQSHALYIGHKDLLKLDQPATITLGFAPPALAGQLTGLDIAYSIWGTPEGADKADWQPLDLLGTQGDGLQLAKSWPGSTGELELGGRRSRWVRAKLRTSMSGRASVTGAASQVRVRVATLDDGTAHAGEGSRTIARAAHNNTPLSTARRFLPFGPEPLRFDEFALAAPEALAKKGAVATLDVTMSDASLTSFEITATGDAAALGGYGASGTGYLESVSLVPGGFQWHELRPADDKGRPLLLATPPAGVGVDGSTADIVVIREPNGDRWAARILRPHGGLDGDWQPLPSLTGSAPNDPSVLVPAPAGTNGVTAVLLDVAQGNLNVLQLDERGKPVSGWLSPSSGAGPGPLDTAGRILPVQDAGWPLRPRGSGFEIVAIDRDGEFWLGAAAGLTAGLPPALAWHRLADRGTLPPVDLEVRPAVTRYAAGQKTPLWIAYAEENGALHGLIHDGQSTRHLPADRTVPRKTALHSNPAILGADGHPVTVALGPAAGEAQLWLGAGRAVRVPLRGVPSAGRALLLRTAAGAPAELVVPTVGERLFRALIDLPVVDYTLHDGVEVETTKTPHRLEITDSVQDPAASRLVHLSDANRRIKVDDLRVFQVDGASLTPGTTTLRFLRLNPPSGVAFAASFDDPNDRSRLHLPAGDTVTRRGMSLIIGDASYPVTDLVGGVATLGFPVLGNDPAPRYEPATVLATTVAAAADLGTLVELDTKTRLEPSAELVFGSGSSPVAQKPSAQQVTSTLWARLPNRWNPRPPDAGRAVIARTPDDPAWTVNVFERGYQNPELSWEYFDGRGWRALALGFSDLTRNLSASGEVTFVVPDDLTTTEVGGTEDYWIRARLIGGDYGRPSYVVTKRPIADGIEVQTVTVDDAALRPPEIVGIEAGFRLDEPVAPEAVLVENNLEVRDETAAAAAATARFELFEGATALDPEARERALYLGLTSTPGQGSLVILADAADQLGTGPARVDLRTADGWRTVGVADDTRALRRRGLITLTLDVDPVLVRLFGRDRIWLRLRPEPAGSPVPWAPAVNRLLVNAVKITHARTVLNEILGSSLGEPSLTLALAETPVLPDTVELRVREELGDEERARLQAAQGAVPAVRTGIERLPGTWVLWNRVDSLIGHDGDARVYLLDPGSGRVRFGDGRTGKIPPAGRDNLRCFGYQQGGGEEGNQPAWTAAKLTSAVEGVDTVVLPIDTAGGFGAPPPESLLATAPHRLRHAGQALSSSDLEALAVASSADIVRARCAGPAGPRQPIRVTIAVRGGARCPIPTLAQRDAVAAALRAAGWGGLGENSIEVTGPVFIHVAVAAHLVAPRARLAEVEQAADAALTTLMDPIAGGPDGTGWPFGRRPVPSDLLRALHPVPGVDRVVSVEITPLGGVPLDRMPADGLACAEVTDIAVVVDSLEGTS